MLSIEILSFHTLLAPISSTSPTGEDLRHTSAGQSAYLSLREARQAARHIERQLLQGLTPTNSSDWQTVYDQAIHLLTTHSKDLEIAAWLCEALLRLQGFKGLAEGFYLIHQLTEKYWEGLYPLPDEEGLYNRIAPLEGLNGNDTDGTLIIPLAKIPLTQGNPPAPFSLWQYQQATELLKLSPEKQAQRIAAGTSTFTLIETAAKETSPDFFQHLGQAIQHCLITFETLHKLLAEKCGNDAPASSRIHTKLTECLKAVEVMSQQEMAAQENKISHTTASPQEKTSKNFLQSEQFQKIDVTVQKREQVLHAILDAAKFFRRTEPHSPLPYLLERAVRWGKMPLSELLREWIRDEPAWLQLCQLTGIEASNK